MEGNGSGFSPSSAIVALAVEHLQAGLCDRCVVQDGDVAVPAEDLELSSEKMTWAWKP